MMFFDLETTTLGAYDYDAKIILAQIYHRNRLTLLKEWDLGEKELIIKLSEIFRDLKPYEPVITYNGGFDFGYVTNRIGLLFDEDERILYDSRFRVMVKHIDVFQYVGRYMVPFNIVLRLNGIGQDHADYGCVMKQMYEKKEYNNIVGHGSEDVVLLNDLLKICPDLEFGNQLGIKYGSVYKQYQEEREYRMMELRKKYGVKKLKQRKM